MKKNKKPDPKDKTDHAAQAIKAKDHLRNDKALNKGYPLAEPLINIADEGN